MIQISDLFDEATEMAARGPSDPHDCASMAETLFLLARVHHLAEDPRTQALARRFESARHLDACRGALEDRMEYASRIATDPYPATSEDMFKLFTLLDEIHALRELGFVADVEAIATFERDVRWAFHRLPARARAEAAGQVEEWSRDLWWYAEPLGLREPPPAPAEHPTDRLLRRSEVEVLLDEAEEVVGREIAPDEIRWMAGAVFLLTRVHGLGDDPRVQALQAKYDVDRRDELCVDVLQEALESASQFAVDPAPATRDDMASFFDDLDQIHFFRETGYVADAGLVATFEHDTRNFLGREHALAREVATEAVRPWSRHLWWYAETLEGAEDDR